ncbi:MAG TPA: M50 family metallopeptidase [Ktedonobacteraceae bacterium]|nr:M50 family metallopeptidase [Ktedonobacteraceae bacterium]
MFIEQKLQKKDLLWLLAYPIYQVIGTARHEGSHALVAVLEGAKIEQFVILPSIVGGHFLWGYVQWSGRTNWVPVAAPYLCDLLTYLVFFFICTRIPFRSHWIWVNLIILGLVSPLINSTYQYVISFVTSTSDVAQLLNELPQLAVHSYFVVTLVLYDLGLLVILTLPSQILRQGPKVCIKSNQKRTTN